jgi:CubicO group peptidase (beta-lactamase class C family)
MSSPAPAAIRIEPTAAACPRWRWLIVAAILLVATIGAIHARPASAASTSTSAQARQIVSIAQGVMDEQHLAGMILRVDQGGHHVVTAALGESMTGVPTTTDMRFRIGSESIPYLTTILLQLQQEGRLSLSDPLSKYLPDSGVPNADHVTLYMLGHAISGYPDWIQGNPSFNDVLLANPFRLWNDSQLLSAAFAQPLICDPGTCFHYAHTNFLLLGQVLTAVTGKPFATLVRERIFKPLHLRHTTITRTALMPAPTLHAYGTDRGPYEDTTSWSPSWGLGVGQLMVSTIDDVARSAQDVLGGTLISPASRRAFTERPPVIKIPIPGLSYGLGVLLSGDWRIQNPFVNDYGGVMAYLPQGRLGISIVSTLGPSATFDGHNPSEAVLTRLAAALAPDHPVHLPSSG